MTPSLGATLAIPGQNPLYDLPPAPRVFSILIARIFR